MSQPHRAFMGGVNQKKHAAPPATKSMLCRSGENSRLPTSFQLKQNEWLLTDSCNAADGPVLYDGSGPFVSTDTLGGFRTFAEGAKYKLAVLESRRSAGRSSFNRSERWL